MFISAQRFDAGPLRPVNADVPSPDYVDARAPRVQRARPVARWICAPDARKPTCIWELDGIGGETRRSPDWLRAA